MRETDDPMAALDSVLDAILKAETEAAQAVMSAFGIPAALVSGGSPPPDLIYMRPEVYAAAIGKAGGQRRARPCKLARRCAARGRGGRWS